MIEVMTNTVETIESVGPNEEAEKVESIRPDVSLKDEIKKSVFEQEQLVTFRAELVKRYVDDVKHGRIETLAESQEELDRRILRGAIFEYVVKMEKQKELSSGDPKIDLIAAELVAVVNDPESLGMEKLLGGKRNPDMAYVELRKKGGKTAILIKGVGEAKFGVLDERSLDQIQEFKLTMSNLVSALNNMSPDNLKEHGLFELSELKSENGSKGYLISMLPEFAVKIVVPSDRDVENGLFGNPGIAINRKEDIRRLNEEFTQLSSKHNVRVTKSLFSKDEIVKLAEEVYAEIKEDVDIARLIAKESISKMVTPRRIELRLPG